LNIIYKKICLYISLLNCIKNFSDLYLIIPIKLAKHLYTVIDISGRGKKIMKVVKRKILGVFLCMLMIATILPAVAGVSEDKKIKTDEPNGIIGKTFMRGIITKPRLVNGGSHVTFRAIYVHYVTWDLRETQRGVLRGFQKITLKNNFIGHCGDPLGHWVFALFDGSLDI